MAPVSEPAVGGRRLSGAARPQAASQRAANIRMPSRASGAASGTAVQAGGAQELAALASSQVATARSGAGFGGLLTPCFRGRGWGEQRPQGVWGRLYVARARLGASEMGADAARASCQAGRAGARCTSLHLSEVRGGQG